MDNGSKRDDLYARLGIEPIINCSGAVTRLGGCRMSQAVLDAMVEAGRSMVDMPELLAAAGRRIAELTGAEAAYVTAGAAAGLMLATAACVAGQDPAKIARLPDTRGMRNEVVIHRQQRMNFDHAIRNAGVTLVDIGWSRGGTHAWELEEAISQQTAAVVFVATFASPACLSLAEVIAIAHAHDVPVIVDAAPELPPVSNLRKFTEMGADLVIFSGGKALFGPQASGFILGRADLIQACALNSNPNHNTIGRPMKVGKEEIAGLVRALELYLERDHDADQRQWHSQIAAIADVLADLPYVVCHLLLHDEHNRPIPQAQIELDDHAPLTAAEVARQLQQGRPSIRVGLNQARIVINPHTLEPGEEEIVAHRLRGLLQGG